MTTPLTPTIFLAALSRDDTALAQISVECEAESAHAAREFTRTHLAGWGCHRDGDLADRVVLVVSELVTNVIMHARTQPIRDSELVTLTLLMLSSGALGVQMTDHSSAMPQPRRDRTEDATGGRGLHLVSIMADAWTTQPVVDRRGTVGKHVWAFFRCPQPALTP